MEENKKTLREKLNNIPKEVKRKKLVKAIISSVVIAGSIVGLAIGNHLALDTYYSNITAMLCPPIAQENVGGNAANIELGEKIVREIQREGSVLVKNEDKVLPFVGAKAVNVFGYNSVDWFYSGSGSGHTTEDENTLNICEALEKYGVQYNKDLYNFYYNYKKPQGVNAPSTLNVTADKFSVLVEPDLSESVKNNSKSFSDYAIVCIGRKGGETEDLPRIQYKYDREPDSSKHYLEASNEEIELLTWVGANFSNVVVLINSTNTMQLDFLDTIPGLKSCLVVGATGNTGTLGICDVLFGEYSPSGHLTDTQPRNLKYNYTYYLGTGPDMTYSYNNSSSNAWPYNRNYKGVHEGTVYYSDYKEGIYVGYKWFETADSVGYWNEEPYNGYENVVQYPFGYGLSYTTFDWELEEVLPAVGSKIESNLDSIEVKVKVTNTGEVAGKDVVQVYLTAPYTPGGIEKSYVSLVGFNKTPTLNPGESVVVPVKLDVSDFKSYDSYDANKNGHTGYELEAGTYQLKLMTDAHNLKQMENNVLEYVVDSTINIDTDEYTGKTVKNLFTGEDAIDGNSVDGTTLNQNIEYISREKFPSLPTQKLPNRDWSSDFEVSPTSECNNVYSREMASAWDNATGLDAFGNPIPTSKPTWGSGSGTNKVYADGGLTELGRELAKPENWENEELWNKILSQVSLKEALDVINTNSFMNSEGVPSAGRPTLVDADGAQQIGGTAGVETGVVGTAYPSPFVTAQCWSINLTYSMGKSYGIDMQNVNRDGTYAFVANIHRSPFGGRNFENFSEDPFLCGKQAAAACRGVAVIGKYCYMKHFAVNDQEFERVGLYTWLTEQALREVYLKPFQECVRNGNMVAVMTSFNRVGATWAGGSEAMISGVLRNEWQFHGMIVTDYCEGKPIMDQSQAVRAGSNYGMSMSYTDGSANELPSTSSSARLQWRLRDSVKEVIYGFINPLYVNEEYNKNPDDGEYIQVSQSKKSWVWWVPALYTIDALAICGLIYLAWTAFKPLDELFDDEDKKKKLEKAGE